MTLRRRKGKTFPDLSGERKEWEHHLQRKKVCKNGLISTQKNGSFKEFTALGIKMRGLKTSLKEQKGKKTKVS